MADGDVLVDTEQTLGDGTRVRLFAVESSSYPGGVNYRFQYYDPETGLNSSVTTTHRCQPTAQAITIVMSGSTARNR